MSSDEAVIRRYVLVDQEDLDEARRLASEHDVAAQVAELKSIEPFSGTVTLLLVGSVLAVTAVMRIIEQHKGGQIIDLRPGAPKLAYRSKDVLYGMVIIVALDGSVRVEVKEPKSLFAEVVGELIKALTASAPSAAADAKSLVDGVVGDRADVSLET